jgi:hypothetical protein
MDTSETYIKMCEKAFKDIGFLPDNGCPSQFITKDRLQWFDNALLLSNADYESQRTDGHIIGEVYRQDQLQAMVGESYRDLLNIGDWANNTDYLSSIRRWKYFISMEQLWLTYVLKQKYNKIWTGEDWVVIE